MEKFPMDLGKASGNALILLKQNEGITNQTRLTGITIYRIPDRREREGIQYCLSDFWGVTMQFQVQPKPTIKYVLLLLDGSNITTNLAWFSPPESDGHKALDTMHALRSQLLESRYKEGPGQSSPYVMLNDRPDFKIPTVQWKQFTTFPMDLEATDARVRTYLATNQSFNIESLILSQIDIQYFIPNGAVIANGLSFSENFDHWLVVFRYLGCKEGDLQPGCNVYVLLDGTILQANTHEARADVSTEETVHDAK